MRYVVLFASATLLSRALGQKMYGIVSEHQASNYVPWVPLENYLTLDFYCRPATYQRFLRHPPALANLNGMAARLGCAYTLHWSCIRVQDLLAQGVFVSLEIARDEDLQRVCMTFDYDPLRT